MWIKIVIGILGGLAVLAGIGWAGLQVRPSNFAPPDDAPKDLGVVDVPADLPAPVRRYFLTAFGEQVPRTESLIALGTGRANFGFWMPLRFRLTHDPGVAFQRDMEVTWFGRTVLKAVDRYVNGAGMTGPVGREATGPAVDQGANMILWAEAPLIPSLWLTDDRIRWEAIDNTSARLIFPFHDGEDELTVHFDPESGLISHLTALRCRSEETGKVPWRVDFLTWQTVDDMTVPEQLSVTWADQGKPWSYWDFDAYYWNVDVSGVLE